MPTLLRALPVRHFAVFGLLGLLGLLGLTACAAPRAAAAGSAGGRPNIIVLFVDDMGWGDLSCFGHPTIRTPSLDRMAREGIRFTQFYSASSVCTPSRAALLTGRLPIRTGMCGKRRVLFPNSLGGLPAEELTLAEGLKSRGYATACIGKWHLGHRKQYLPRQNGFDSYFGIPYSNDMDRLKTAPKGRAAFNAPKSEYWNVPLMRDDEIIERPARQDTLTQRYTAEAVRFIEQHAGTPFFVYLPYTMVHVPLFASEDFTGKSARGLFGDAVEEIDWSVGRILATLVELGVDDDTFVFFTSDNGPWLPFRTHGGSAGPLKSGKGSTWEGGMREPAIARWPAGIGRPGRVSHGLGCTMDIYTTCLKLAGAALPTDRIVDGVDLTPVLRGTGESPRKTMAYYRGTELFAWRSGPFKLHLVTQSGYGGDSPKRHDPPLLFQLEHDPGEKHDVAKAHPDVLERMLAEVAEHKARMKPGKPQLAAVEQR